jgi:hypothetical protein
MCLHAADNPIFEWRGRELRAANCYGFEQARELADCIIDLAGLTRGSVGTRAPQGAAQGAESWFRELERLVNPAERPVVLRLHWPDMTAPSVGLDFWRRLWELLPEGVIVVACCGGHGRTGTALASLLVAAGMDPDAAIDYVRTTHCTEAIETAEQEEYVRRLR